MAQSPTSTISPALPSSPNYSLEEIHITFEHFFDYFSLEKTPFNYQLFYLWLQPPSSPPSTILLQASSTTPSTTTPLSMNYLFFICSIWYVLTMEQEDIAAFIFNLYATAKGPSTKYITVSSIKTALDHIHPFATCNKLLQKLIKDLPNEIDGLTFAEWWEWCSEHTMILEPIFQQQNQLRQAIGTNDLWKALTIKRTQNPSQNNPNYLIFLHNLYDEAMLKYALTSRLNDLTKLKTRSYSFTRESDSLIQPNIDIDPMISASEDDYPQLTLKRKPSGSSSSTASVQNLVIVSNCSTPFSAAGVILHDVMYDTDGDSISIPSPGSGKCSDYESIFYEDPENPPGRWDTKDGDDGLLSPRSVLSEANCYDESEDDDNEQQ